MVSVMLIAVLLFLFVFAAINSVIEVWSYIRHLPLVLYYYCIAFISLTLLFSLWLAYKLFEPSSIKSIKEDLDEKNISIKSILKELSRAEKKGMDISSMRSEIELLQARKHRGTIHVALFGDVSTGKSSIIKALLPDAQVEIDVRGGSTPNIKEYTWQNSSGEQLILTDLPGRNEVKGKLDLVAEEEAIRAEIVIYVTDSDLSRSQFKDIQRLNNFGKPLLIALNKSDRISDEEKKLIDERFKEYFPNQSIKLAFIQSGGKEEVLKIYSDDSEEKLLRERRADVVNLTRALQNEISTQSGILEKRRDESVFKLVMHKLDSAKIDFRKTKSEDIIKSSTQKAILGALISIPPGSDLIIQGLLGAQMVKQLCALYEIPIRELDIDKLQDSIHSQIRLCILLVLIVGGNGLKTLFGLGTVVGGLIHIVAYSLIFHTLGHAINKALSQQRLL